MAFGRSKLKGFFDKRRMEVARKEWVVAENRSKSQRVLVFFQAATDVCAAARWV